MELNFPFGVNSYLNASSASSIYSTCNDLLQDDQFSTQGLLKQFNVKMVGTTDDPCDSLEHHQQIQQDKIGIKVLPSFRPDKAFNISNKETFIAYLQKLEKASGVKINQIPDLLNALEKRLNYFHENGCRISDHGIFHMPLHFENTVELENEFKKYIEDKSITTFSQPERFIGVILFHLCKLYHKNGWVQQFHLGSIRNNNSRLLNSIGADAGVDSMGDFSQAQALASFMDALDKTDQLAKSILYNINPADNEMFAAMCWNFNDGKTKGKIQYGSGWWFLDQKDGIEKQLNALSNMGTISTFVGMITDSRSFLSYSRHEYFRRVLCNLLGNEMEKGLIPDDKKWIGGLVQDICYNNAVDYFNFK
jgi:glucuronate isomerase